MEYSSAQPARVRAAIALSIVLHLCGLTLLAIILATKHPSGTLVADLLPVSLTRLVRAPVRTTTAAPARPLPSAAVVPASRAVSVRVAPPSAVRTKLLLASPALPHRGPGPRRARQGRSRITRPQPAPAGETAMPPTVVAAVPSAADQALPEGAKASPAPALLAPSPTPTSHVVAGAPNGFGGLFSQNYPPAIATPAVIDSLRARLHGHGHIQIAVDETGHATEIRFIVPVDDEAAERDVRAQLSALTYVPADCSGLPCDGTLDLTY